MNLFPRKYKEKTLSAQNRLEVLDAGVNTLAASTPPGGTSRGARPQRGGLVMARKDGSSPTMGGPAGPAGGDAMAQTAPSLATYIPSAAPETSVSEPRARKKVYMTTVRKDQPLKRYTRDLTRGRDGHERRDRARQGRDEVDPVEECTTTASFNFLLKGAVKKTRDERKALAIRAVTKMRAMQVPLDLETYNSLLVLLVDSPEQDCIAIYEQMKEDCKDGGIKPDLNTFHSLFQACERTGQFQKAFELLSEMKLEHGLLPDTNMYNKLLGFCVLRRDEHRASSLFEEMKKGKVQPNVHTYNSLMNVFAENPAELLAQMFDDMTRQSISPNLRTYNTLMRSCQRTGDYDKAFKLFEELKAEPLEPDVVTYNILIDMCKERIDFLQGKNTAALNGTRRNEEQQENRIRGVCVLALSLFNEMDEKEIRPNTFTYNALMGVLARCADLRIFTVFTAMKADAKEEEEDRAKLQELLDSGELQDSEGALLLAGLGDPQDGLLMDDKSGAALRGHYQRLLIGDEYLARQSAFGVKPDITTYHTLLTAAERMGKAETAYELFEELKATGIQPDNATYIKMMDVCVLNSETDRALELFNEASEKMVVPDVELYNAFINVLAEAGDPDVFESFQKFTTDRTNNMKPNHRTYNTMIKVCTKLRREGDPGPNDPLPTDEEGLHAREELIGLRNAERQERGLAIYEEMCDPGCTVKPNVDTYGALLDVCHLTRDIERARAVVDDMQSRGLVPTITTYNKLMQVFVAAKDPAIREIFDMLKQRYAAASTDALLTPASPS